MGTGRQHNQCRARTQARPYVPPSEQTMLIAPNGQASRLNAFRKGPLASSLTTKGNPMKAVLCKAFGPAENLVIDQTDSPQD